MYKKRSALTWALLALSLSESPVNADIASQVTDIQERVIHTLSTIDHLRWEVQDTISSLKERGLSLSSNMPKLSYRLKTDSETILQPPIFPVRFIYSAESKSAWIQESIDDELYGIRWSLQAAAVLSYNAERYELQARLLWRDNLSLWAWVWVSTYDLYLDTGIQLEMAWYGYNEALVWSASIRQEDLMSLFVTADLAYTFPNWVQLDGSLFYSPEMSEVSLSASWSFDISKKTEFHWSIGWDFYDYEQRLNTFWFKDGLEPELSIWVKHTNNDVDFEWWISYEWWEGSISWSIEYKF